MQCNGLKTEISGVAEFGDGGSHINPPLASTMQWRVSNFFLASQDALEVMRFTN